MVKSRRRRQAGAAATRAASAQTSIQDRKPASARPISQAEPPPIPARKPAEPQQSLAELMAAQTPDSLEALSRNFAEAMTRANTVFATAFHDQSRGPAMSYRADPFDVQGAMNQAWGRLATQPETLRDAHGALWQAYADIWQDNMSKWMQAAISGEAPPPSPPVGDKRFRDPEWQNNPFFSIMRDTYLATANWITGLVEQAEGLDEQTKRKAAFFVKQAVDAASPSNFLFTNPAALRATLAASGENLLLGVENLAQDLKRGQGMLSITQTDINAFTVGKNIATTPGKVVFRNELIELLQYDPTTETVHETPLLFLPPWINKFYILDLQPKNSLIKWMVDQGYTVFVVSWANPDGNLAQRTFEDYMQEGIFAALDAVEKATGIRQVNAVGYCIAGTLLAATLSYMAQVGDDRIASATFFAAQTDFKCAGDLLVFTDESAISYVEERMEAKGGVLDAQAMADTFNALRSNDLIWNNVVQNYYIGGRPAPFDLLYWNSDQTRMPSALHLFYLKRFYKDNALAEGNLRLLGKTVSLGDVTIPIFMQSSREDHIAPAESVYRSAKLFGGPVEFVMAGSGHIAGVINPPAANKYQHWLNSNLPAKLEEWLADAIEHPGSWWMHWDRWLAARSGPDAPARRPGDSESPALGDAPGRYVMVKSIET